MTTQRLVAPPYTTQVMIDGRLQEVPIQLTKEQLLINELLDRIEVLEILAGIKK